MSDNWLFGHPMEYWLELSLRMETLDPEGFFQEIVDLRGKVNFYESRIQQMAALMNEGENK